MAHLVIQRRILAHFALFNYNIRGSGLYIRLSHRNIIGHSIFNAPAKVPFGILLGVGNKSQGYQEKNRQKYPHAVSFVALLPFPAIWAHKDSTKWWISKISGT
jgi:hypothetical protein